MRGDGDPTPNVAQQSARASTRQECTRASTRQGAAFMIVAGLFMTIEVAFLRFLSPTVDNGHLLLIRGGVQLLFAAIWVLYAAGLAGFKTKRLGLHAARGIISAISWWFYFESFRVLGLALSTTLVFSSQIFVVLLASVILGERLTLPRIVCTIIGFIGVVIATGVFQGTGFDSRASYGLISACMGASLILLTRVLAHTERTDTTLFYIALFVTAGAVPQVLWSGTSLAAWDFWVLVSVGVTGTISGWFLVEAYRRAEVSALAPFPYLRLVFAAAFGYVFFGEPLTWAIAIGAALIVAGSLTMAWVERR